MAWSYGTKTANIMDIPLFVSSVVAPYLGDNGYKWDGVNSVRVLSVADGSLVDYDETDANTPFGAPNLIVPVEQVLALAYNKAMLLRIQRTQIQDIPVGQFAKQVALQQANDVFVPAHDAYSLGKIFAARNASNIQALDTTDPGGGNGVSGYALSFGQMVSISRTYSGGNTANLVAWVTYAFKDIAGAQINFTGSEAGYAAGKNGYLGKLSGVPVVEVPNNYLFPGVYALCVDKRAVVNVTPKMDPKAGGMLIVDPVPGFSGIEIQLRDRSDTYVLNRKALSVASLELASATTASTTLSGTTTVVAGP